MDIVLALFILLALPVIIHEFVTDSYDSFLVTGDPLDFSDTAAAPPSEDPTGKDD